MSSSHIFPRHDVVSRERNWCESVVDAYGVDGVLLTESTLDLRALSHLGHSFARSLGVLPLGWVDGRLHIAAAGLLDPVVIAGLARSHGCPVVVLLAASPLLSGAIDAAYAAVAARARTLAGLRSLSAAPHLELVRCTARDHVADWLEPVASTG